MATDSKLWKVFSEFIRLRDSDGSGYCKCITCGLVRHWKQMDCGHGIPRQHKATKYNEMNNAAQCKRCNGFEGGKREVYKEEVNKRYGEGTWEKLEVMSRAVSKAGPYEFKVMEAYYKSEVEKLKKLKGIL